MGTESRSANSARVIATVPMYGFASCASRGQALPWRVVKPILIILGTRPEAVKIRPVLRELSKRGHPFTVVCTGQHTNLFDQTGFAAEFPLTALGVANLGEPMAFAEAVVERLRLWAYDKPEHVVLVQGDTSSAYAGGLFAKGLGWPLVHLEAGLRTHDRDDPWPEEMFREYLDKWAQLRLAPTPTALHNLHNEQLVQGSLLIGNTVVDALADLDVRFVPYPVRPKVVIITLHRRESWGEPMERILNGIRQIALETENRHGYVFRWPAHPAKAVQELADQMRAWSIKHKQACNLRIEPPLEYPRFVRTLAYARAVITDSGGVVEEAATLGVPCVIARDKSERMEAVASGQAIMGGREAGTVAYALREALAGKLVAKPSHIFGDGTAASQAVDAMEAMYGQD